MSEPLLSVPCDEPGGTVVRHVYPMLLTPENLKTLWEKSRKYKTLFGKDVRGDFGKFARLLIKQHPNGELESTGLYLLVDDFIGVFYMTNIAVEAGSLVDASVHYSFFDGRHHGRLNLVKAMIKYGFQKYNFRRLSTEIPLYAKRDAFRFAELVGFRNEGRKRKATLFEDEWFDVNLFGILREEVLK